MNLSLPDAADTRALGIRIGGAARRGDLVLLTGPLGAGKTVLAQGIGAGLGIERGIVSPTFVLARVHREGRIPLVHVDAYRLGGLAELDDLDLDSDLAESVTVVEWGAGVAERLATEYLQVALRREPGSDVRTATLTASGAGWTQRLAALIAASAAGSTSAVDIAASAAGSTSAVSRRAAASPGSPRTPPAGPPARRPTGSSPAAR